ncbi:MAG: ATP-binding protein [Bacteroidia bacterium]
MEAQKLELESTIESLKEVEKLVDQVCVEYKVNEDYYGNILIAVTEAVNNAIIHGNKQNPQKKYYVTFMPKEDQIIFTIADQGEGFDYNNLPDPTDPQNIEKPNGRGVFLMKNLADKIEFEENGSKVNISFKIFNN